MPVGKPSAKKRRLKTRIDLDAVIFDGDRDLREALMADDAIRSAVRELEPAAALAAARRDLLLSSLKLTPRIAPDLFGAVDRVKKALGLRARLELYCVSSPVMNAFVAPPDADRVLMGVSSPLLEKMDGDELAFVLGHELGHALFDHFRMAPSVLLDQELRLPPLQVARLFAWMRYAELSADRVGLLCAGDVDATIRAFFKLTSGLCDERFLASARESASQLSDLSESAMASTEEDWFATHPYGPLRIKAIDLFARSETYFSLIGRVGGELSESELEQQVAELMALMDPCFFAADIDCHDEIHEMLALGGLKVALADGTLKRSEHDELERLLAAGLHVDDALVSEVLEGGFEPRLEQLGRHLAMRLPVGRRMKIVEDLTAIALADEQLADAERDALGQLAELLELDPLFVDQSLARVAAALD